MRTINAAAELDQADMRVDGQPISPIAPDKATGYTSVPPGRHDLSITRRGGAGGALASASGVPLVAGSASTAIVVGSGGEPAQVLMVSDQTAGPSVAPATGFIGDARATADPGCSWRSRRSRPAGSGAPPICWPLAAARSRRGSLRASPPALQEPGVTAPHPAPGSSGRWRELITRPTGARPERWIVAALARWRPGHWPAGSTGPAAAVVAPEPGPRPGLLLLAIVVPALARGCPHRPSRGARSADAARRHPVARAPGRLPAPTWSRVDPGAAPRPAASASRYRPRGVQGPVDPIGRWRGQLEIPPPGRAGWFRGGPRPGEPGRAVIVSHVDSQAGPALFAGLRTLKRRTRILVEDRSGRIHRFRLVRRVQVQKSRFRHDLIYAPSPRPTLVLITCGGPFTPGDGYRDNVILYARAA